MRFEIAISSLFLSATVFANAHVHPGSPFGLLEKRQDQFVPNTTTAEGTTCADAFGDGYDTCRNATDSQNRLCFNPNIGQSCCQNQWACPADSFCLDDGSCCPNGTDAAACAAAGSTSSSSLIAATTSTAAASGSHSATATGPKATVTGANGSTATANFAADSWRSKGANIGFAGLVLGAVVML